MSRGEFWMTRRIFCSEMDSLLLGTTASDVMIDRVARAYRLTPMWEFVLG